MYIDMMTATRCCMAIAEWIVTYSRLILLSSHHSGARAEANSLEVVTNPVTGSSYILIERKGEGQQATVYRAVNQTTQEECAIKIHKIHQMYLEESSRLSKAAELKCACIIQLLDHFIDETSGRGCIVIPLAQCSLQDRMYVCTTLPSSDICAVFTINNISVYTYPSQEARL